MNVQVYWATVIPILSHTYPWFMPCLQDVVLTVPPYPFVLEDPSTVPFEEFRVVCPQLFFTCHLRPTDGWLPKASSTYGEDDIQVALVFYSTFEQQDLPGSGRMDKRDVQDYYEPTPTPTLYVGQVSNALSRVQLMPLFLLGNATPTIPYELRKYQRNRFPYGRTDTAQESCRRGCNVYELNAWLWHFGRGKPRVGGLSVADIEDRRIAGARRGHATRTKRKHKAP